MSFFNSVNPFLPPSGSPTGDPPPTWKTGWKVVRLDARGRMLSCTLVSEWVEYVVNKPTYRPEHTTTEEPRSIYEQDDFTQRETKYCGPLTVFTSYRDSIRFLAKNQFYYDHQSGTSILRELITEGYFHGELEDTYSPQLRVVRCVYKESPESYLWCWRRCGRLLSGETNIFSNVPEGTAFADVVVVLPNTSISAGVAPRPSSSRY